jgi:glycosyltransferase involved in cell wall biosynthesis
MTMSGRDIGGRMTVDSPAGPDRREILIFEPAAGGHEMHYVQIIATGLASAGLAPLTLVTTEAALQHESTRALRAAGIFAAIDAVRPEAIPLRLPYRLHARAAGQYRDTMALARYVETRGGVDRFRMLFIPFLDSSSIVPLALGRYPFDRLPFAGVLIRPTYHLRAAGVPVPRRIKNLPEKAIYRRLLAHPRLAALFTIDPYFADIAADPRIIHVPDPAEFAGSPVPGATRRKLSIAEDAVVVLVYGHIDRRKGFGTLLRGVAALRSEAPVVVIAAGRQHPELMGPLPEPETSHLRDSGRLIEFDRYIAPEEEHALFEAADIVWVCYGNRYAGMSGVMVKAGQAGKPIITALGGITAQTVRDHSVGVTADAGRVDSVAAAIRRLAADPDLRRRLGDSGRRRFAPHSPASFALPIVERLKTLLSRDAPGEERGRRSDPAEPEMARTSPR